MQQEQTEQKEYRKRILWLAEQMQYDDDIEESVVQFKNSASANKDTKTQEPEGAQEAADDDDDEDLMMDAETMFIEKQSSHQETITVLDDDPKASRRVT